ncbi:MAG: hypothetical protein ACI861_000345 [Paracoccaceae bacterium]|jgi:hypothetical protein
MKPFAKLTFAFILAVFPATAQAFCGFYVARADGNLYNEASKVVYVRDGQKSVITMSSDYKGPAKEFAMIVPTPKVLKRAQVRTVKPETIAHLDAYSAPRLVEYFDEDPCGPQIVYEPMVMEERSCGVLGCPKQEPIYRRADALGVKIKAKYAVGDYDILILQAKQSDGLEIFLRAEGYNVPDGATKVLQHYIKARMKFFVARVNLKRFNAKKTQVLPPLQISFRSSKFMLPIQLGKINASGPQDLLLMTLTRKGRVETTNYQTKKLPTDINVPSFVEKKFADFYRATYDRKVGERGGIVMEYAWDMAWCDPCAADPLSREELLELGVTWLKKKGDNAGQDVFVTRLHARYDKTNFHEDLKFRITSDKTNFQGRYVMNQPFKGNVQCEAGRDYVKRMRLRLRQEALEVAKLTGWAPRKIEQQIRATVPKSYW